MQGSVPVKVGVVGTTRWGTTLGMLLARRGLTVYLWSRTPQEARLLNRLRENPRLPGYPFPDSMKVTSSAEEALEEAQLAIFAVPSATLRENVRHVRSALDSPIVMSATKGLEVGTGKRMSQVLEEELPPGFRSKICVLSGPNLSQEVIQGVPSSSVIAAYHEEVALRARELMACATFQVYTDTDVIGVELGGALKNVIALGVGIGDGLKYGANAKAAFVTRGLAEITSLGKALGANPLTFMGLAGLGDLLATCFSPLSRNRYLGQQLALGRNLEELLASMRQTVEGVDTTMAACRLAQAHKVEMPITETIYRVLFQGLNPRAAACRLFGDWNHPRPPAPPSGTEWHWPPPGRRSPP